MGPGGAVANGKGAIEGPVVVDGAAFCDHSAQGILQAFAIACLAADFDVGDEAEERAAPVGATPGMGSIDARITGPGLALAHAMHHVSPDLLRLQFPGHDAGKRFNVSRDSLFHPMLIVGQRGERRVHQLVGRDPVIREVRGGGVLRDAEACEALKAIDAAPGRALNLLSSATFNGDTNRMRARVTGKRP